MQELERGLNRGRWPKSILDAVEPSALIVNARQTDQIE